MKNSGLHLKLVTIMLLIIVSLMGVVCAFLVRGVLNFYLKEFYNNMHEAFSITEFADALRSAADDSSGEHIGKILSAYSGILGVDAVNRNYYVLDGETGEVLKSSNGDSSVEMTPNIIKALNGNDGYESDNSSAYMDIALPIKGSGGNFIIYIKDNKKSVRQLNLRLFMIIIEALIVGLIISVFLSFLLAKTMVTPIQSLTRAANRVAKGDFSQPIEVTAHDEIGVLTQSFNNMAKQLRDTLEEIENERNKLSTVFLHMTDGVVAFSRDGVKIHYNPAAEELLGVSLSDPELDYSVIFASLDSLENVLALKSPEAMRFEREIKGKILEIILTPFAGGEGTQGGIMAVVHDVTQQRKSEQMRREFVANVSHELRTPVTNIRSYAETLIEVGKDISEEERSHFLSVILNESDRMTKIVQDLLMLSKFDAGKTDLKFEKFDIVKSTRNIYDAMLLNVKKRGMKMTLEIPDEPVFCEGDRARIEQVIVNITTNAARYTPNGGSIIMSAGREEGGVWVSVKDTGIGIPKEDLQHVFERFYRVDKARSRALGGSGLGLSIAKEIVARHNGNIEIESKQGKGTKVTVHLPEKQQTGGGGSEE